MTALPQGQWLLATWLALALASASGCSNLTYDMIKLGSAPQDYERRLPADASRRTSLGVCYYKKDAVGQTDAIVLLLTSDRRVAAKMQATRIERNWGLKTERSFVLRGELNPELYDVRSTGPIDTLRAIAHDVSEYRGEQLAADAHRLISAGLVRLMQRWPRIDDVGVSSQRLPELFEQAAGGGTARIAVDESGVYQFEYRQGVRR